MSSNLSNSLSEETINRPFILGRRHSWRCSYFVSSEATWSWSLSPLIVGRDSFSHQTWPRLKTGGAQPVLFECRYIYFLYIIFITFAVCVSIFMTSPLGVEDTPISSTGIRIQRRPSTKIIFTYTIQYTTCSNGCHYIVWYVMFVHCIFMTTPLWLVVGP